MRRILRRHEVVIDDWVYAHEDAGEPGHSLILTLSQLEQTACAGDAGAGLATPPTAANIPARLGVRIEPGDEVRDLEPFLTRLSLVAIGFPSPGEGRGFSQARLLRTRCGFGGEIRAVGAGVKQDLLFLMARCGIDAFELAPGETFDSARRALRRYSVAYQPGASLHCIREQRYRA